MKKSAKRLSIRFKFMMALCLTVGLIYLMATASAYVSPQKFSWIALTGLAFPYLFLVMAGFMIYWLLTKHFKSALIILIMIVSGFPVARHYFALPHYSKSKSENKHSIKIMTWNVRNFDLYNWSHNRETRHAMLALIKKSNPDILCLQEFFTKDKDTAFDNISALRAMGYHYWHFNNGFTLRLKEHWGLAIFSKYRIDSKNTISFSGGPQVNGCIYDDIHVRDTTVRLFCVHLQSIFLNDSDYAHIDHLDPEDEKGRQDMMAITYKLRRAFIKRSIQADTIHKVIEKSPFPIILCGDFNDTPASYTYNQLSNDLTDAFVEQGKWVGKTYIGPVPSFRIDYCLHSPYYRSTEFDVIHKKLSDHYPLLIVMGR